MNTFRSKPSRRKTLILWGVILALALAGALLVVALLNAKNESETIRGSLEERWAEPPKLNIAGEMVPYNQKLVNVLIMGIDRTGEEARPFSFRNNGQADFLLLMTVDEQKKNIRFLQIDRDTVTDIAVLSVLGEETGTRPAQICLAHGFGGTRERSSELVVKAVENLLFGVPVDRYISIFMDDMGAIADVLGGVPVTLAEDLTDVDPSFVKGAKVLLEGDLANRFVRQRLGVGDGTNQARMLRHQAFMISFLDKLKSEMYKSRAAADDLYRELSQFLFTDFSVGHIINLMSGTRGFETMPVSTLPGTHSIGANGFMEFQIEQTALQQYVTEQYTYDNK